MQRYKKYFEVYFTKNENYFEVYLEIILKLYIICNYSAICFISRRYRRFFSVYRLKA